MSRIASSPIAGSQQPARRRWRLLTFPSALAFAAFAFAMHDTFLSLFNLWWHSDGYGHGFVVLGGAAYLLYLRREAIAAVPLRSSVGGLLAVCALMAVWLASRVLSVLIGEEVVLVLTLLALLLALYGAQLARLVALPILYLFCAVPVWSYLVPALRDSTAQASTWLSRQLGVPIYLEGVYMSIPDGVFLVAEVCAGISYLLAAMSLGVFYALLNLSRLRTRVALVAVAIAAGVVFNWIRVTSIVLIGHHSQMQHPLVDDHITFGWLLFVPVIFFVIACGRLLERFDGTSGEGASFAAAGSAATHPGREPQWLIAGLCALALSVPAYAALRLTAPSWQTAAVSLPDQLGHESGWRPAREPSRDGWSASILGDASETRASYRKDAQRVDVHVGYFAMQRQGSEAVNDRHAMFDAENWDRVSQRVVARQVAVAPGLMVNEMSIRRLHGPQKRLVWWWYWVDGQFTADPVEAKILQLRAIFSGQRQAAIVIVSSTVAERVEKTRDGMQGWLSGSAQAMAASLQAVAAAVTRGRN